MKIKIIAAVLLIGLGQQVHGATKDKPKFPSGKWVLCNSMKEKKSGRIDIMIDKSKNPTGIWYCRVK
ncbi:hypothetical protein [Aestuariivirga sp.]|uniref:hypothetical protein n=1 Tax=Aestuariivirga sp. TaxID=2650926 RepID=UPI0039E23952